MVKYKYGSYLGKLLSKKGDYTISVKMLIIGNLKDQQDLKSGSDCSVSTGNYRVLTTGVIIEDFS